MENPVKMSAPDPAPDANIDAMNVATPGKDAPNLDKTAPKRALFSSPSAVAHNKTNISTPTTTDKRNTRESKNLMDNRHMQLADNEQMGDVCKQLRFIFIEKAHASEDAMNDMRKQMTEMQTRQRAELEMLTRQREEMHMRQMAEMKMLKTIIEQQQTIIEQQQTILRKLQQTINNLMQAVTHMMLQRYKEEQEQEKEQEEQEQQRQQEEGEQQQEEQQRQQAAATALADSSTSRQQQQQATAEQDQRDQQEHRVQIDGKWLSARADRRQAALQRQDREREEQQWFAVTANIPTTSAIAAPAIATAVVTTTVLTAVPTISTAFTASAVTTAVTAVAVTAVTTTAIACAPTAISTAVTHAISTAFIAFAIAAIATAIFTAVTSSISIDFTAFAASGIVFPSVPRTLGPRKLSARADRRLAALQRQEREREEQQWVEQLRKREPKASGNERAALRYLTREIGTVVFS